SVHEQPRFYYCSGYGSVISTLPTWEADMATQVTAVDKFVTVNGLRLHYLDWGNEAAPPIVMLHGLRGYARTWDGVAQPLTASYHVVALDQRGRGDSDW